jgi:hypothetical protein
MMRLRCLGYRKAGPKRTLFLEEERRGVREGDEIEVTAERAKEILGIYPLWSFEEVKTAPANAKDKMLQKESVKNDSASKRAGNSDGRKDLPDDPLR